MNQRRRKNSGKRRRTHRFSRLLRCDTCGSTLYRQQNGPRSEPERAILRCSNKELHENAEIVESQMIRQLTEQLQRLLSDVELPHTLEGNNTTGKIKPARRVLDQVELKRKRYQRAFGDGLISYEDFAARLSEVEAEADEARRVLEDFIERKRRRRDLKKSRATMQQILEALPDYLEQASREEVNRALRDLLEAVFVAPNGEIVHLELR